MTVGGCTDKQLETIKELEAKKKLTEKQAETLQGLKFKRDNPELTQGVKSVLDEIYIAEAYNRKQIITSKYLTKGTNQEDESIALYRKVTQEFCTKNEEKLSNDFICGTPDLILEDRIVDTKTSFQIWSYAKANQSSALVDYYYQVVGYMILTGKTKGELAFCLISNTEEVIYQEIQKLRYGLGLTENTPEFDEMEKQIRHNNNYEDIPASQRVKRFSFDLDPAEKGKIEKQLKLCREYLNSKVDLI
jgi:hypothetical protein